MQLIGGVGFAAAYGLSGYYINVSLCMLGHALRTQLTLHSQSVDAAVGHKIGAITSFALTGVMGLRLVKTKKVVLSIYSTPTLQNNAFSLHSSCRLGS